MTRKLPTFIEVETATYCNRTCTWCPNGWNDRGRREQYISDVVWLKLLNELSEYDYKGWFAFHNYNEPLADPTIFEKINQARHLLPKAKLALYSNGDYLTQEVLGQLAELGVDETRVTLYPSASHAFDKPSTARMISFLNRLSIDVASKDICETSKRIEVRIDFQGTELHIIVPHIQLYTDRGGAVPLEELTLQTVRTQPCFLPSLSAAIDYQGNLKLCCQIYDATLPANQQYIIGNVADEGFMQLWFSEKMEMFRRRLSTADFEGLDACTHCTHALSLYQRQALNERA